MHGEYKGICSDGRQWAATASLSIRRGGQTWIWRYRDTLAGRMLAIQSMAAKALDVGSDFDGKCLAIAVAVMHCGERG